MYVHHVVDDILTVFIRNFVILEKKNALINKYRVFLGIMKLSLNGRLSNWKMNGKISARENAKGTTRVLRVLARPNPAFPFERRRRRPYDIVSLGNTQQTQTISVSKINSTLCQIRI